MRKGQRCCFVKVEKYQRFARYCVYAMMQNGVAWQDVLEGDEVERFLKSFIMPEDIRRHLQKSDPDTDLSALPTTLAQVQKDVSNIWRSKGYLTPAALKNELIQQYLPDTADPALRTFITDIELSRQQPEDVTGYLSKEHAYLATGLAHLYALDSGMPMAMVEIDFSNMGGTNAHFRDLLAREEGVMPEEIDPRRAEMMTNRAMRLLAATIVDLLYEELPEERIVPIRAGGDELHVLITGVGNHTDILSLTNRLHGAIEKHVACMGLQDHPHLKAPDDPLRNGFGAALHIQDMAIIENPQTIIQEMGGLVSAQKQILAQMRLGQIDREAVEAQAASRLLFGDAPVSVELIDQLVADEVDKALQESAIAANTLRNLNPVHNPTLQGGVAGFHAYVDQAMPSLHEHFLPFHPVPPVLAAHLLGGNNRPEGVLPMAGMEARYMALSDQHFEDHGVMLDAAQRHLLCLSVQGLMSEDPSAKVMMPQAMVKTIDSIGADNRDFKAQFDPHDSLVAEALSAAGLQSLNRVGPYGLGISLHNLAGLNNALGHHNADLVLRHMGQHVIAGALAYAGAREGGSAIAHHGGGNFSVLLYPGGIDENGKPWFSSPAMLNKIRVEIKKRMSDLNNTDVSAFLLQNDVYVNAAMEAYFEKEGLKTFRDIEDTKTRIYPAEKGDMAYKLNGMHAVVATGVMAFDGAGDPVASGGAFVGQLRNAADKKIEQMRTHMFLSGRAQAIGMGNDTATAQDYTKAFNHTARAIRQSSAMDRGLTPDRQALRERNRVRFPKPPAQKG